MFALLSLSPVRTSGHPSVSTFLCFSHTHTPRWVPASSPTYINVKQPVLYSSSSYRAHRQLSQQVAMWGRDSRSRSAYHCLTLSSFHWTTQPWITNSPQHVVHILLMHDLQFYMKCTWIKIIASSYLCENKNKERLHIQISHKAATVIAPINNFLSVLVLYSLKV